MRPAEGDVRLLEEECERLEHERDEARAEAHPRAALDLAGQATLASALERRVRELETSEKPRK